MLFRKVFAAFAVAAATISVSAQDASLLTNTAPIVRSAPPARAPRRPVPLKATVSPLGPTLKTTDNHRTVELPALSADVMKLLKRQDAEDGKRWRIGVGRDLEKPVMVGEQTTPASGWTVLPNGWQIWTLKVTSHEAVGLRLRIESMNLPAGAQLIVYNPAKPAVTAKAVTKAEAGLETWTGTIFSDSVVVECQLPPGVKPERASFSVTGVAHIYRALSAATSLDSGPCEINVACYPDWQAAADGVAMIDFVDSGSVYACTGCLLNDSDPGTTIDYFLTAHHCVRNKTIAETLEATWFYQADTCGGIAPSIDNFPFTSGGADFLATSVSSDATLLRLREAPPDGVTYQGWTTALPTSSETLTTIHHPQGYEKKISFGNEVFNNNRFWTVQWLPSLGVTEEGSSGSPLFTPDQLVIGQLYGGSSSCDTPTGLDDYGRFDVTYKTIHRWIDNFAFLRVQGGYNGLFSEASGARNEASGFFTLKLADQGSYSASFRLEGKLYSLSGHFDETGAATNHVPRKGLSMITVQMTLDITAGAESITGTIGDGTWLADLLAKRAVFNARTNPAPFAPKYTMVFPGGNDSASPRGHGYATLTCSANGLAKLIGSLADGKSFSQSVPVSGDGTWPLYGNLYGGKGVIEGWMTLDNSRPNDDLNGTVMWIKAPQAAKYYPAGFDVSLLATGSVYVPPPTRSSQILPMSSGTVSFSGGNLDADFSNAISLSAENKVMNQGPNRLSLSFVLATGLFNGGVTPPSATRSTPFHGVVLQKSVEGFGYFLGTTESGSVVLAPGP